jgi:hypothetical protein
MLDTIPFEDSEFVLGCLDRVAPVGSVRPCLESAIAILPQSSWQPVDNSAFVGDCGLQGNHGACVGFNTLSAYLAARAIAGLEPVKLSPWDLYAQVCGGKDQGATIHSALQALHDRGVATLAAVPNFTVDANCGGDAAKQEASRYRAIDSFDCPDQASIATAVQLGFPTPIGVAVYQNFTSLETIGGYACVPKPRGKLRGGHCVAACGLAQIGGTWRLKIATKSWGENFGQAGCVWYALDWLDDSFADAWCLRTVTV